MTKRLLLIGLDCAAPQLVFDRWWDALANMRALAERGSYGVLRSCDPPITVPAWSVMMSSRDPGALGVYGFRNRIDRGYDHLEIATSRAIKEPRVWDLLGKSGRKVVVLGVPQTYPPPQVNGSLVSCFLTPDTRRNAYTYPPELKLEIEQTVGEYLVDVRDFRSGDKVRIKREVDEMTIRRFKLAEHFVQSKPWDLFAMVEIGVDRVHHAFWRYMDPEHRLYEAGSPFENVIRDYYILVDELIGRLLAHVDEHTAVLVVSDHGAKRMDGAICVNEWLRRNGYLALREDLKNPRPLELDMIDWARTRAWGEGGYYARVFLNVAGREPHGIVPAQEYDNVRSEIADGLSALGDEDGQSIGTSVRRPEDFYRVRNGVPPDLLVYFGDLHWRSAGLVGGPIHLRENDTGPDDANHAHEGLYILAAQGVSGGRGPEQSIEDVAPTILRVLNEPVPASMQGHVFVACTGLLSAELTSVSAESSHGRSGTTS